MKDVSALMDQPPTITPAEAEKVDKLIHDMLRSTDTTDVVCLRVPDLSTTVAVVLMVGLKAMDDTGLITD